MFPQVKIQKFYYGWLVLAVGFFVIMCGMGIRSSFGVFITPMEEDLNWNRNTITRVLSLGIFIGALSFVVVGYLNDKFGGRLIVIVCLSVLGLTTFFTGRINSIPSFVLIYAFIGSFASSGVGFVVIHSILSKWFSRRRPLAISISVAGGSIGPTLFAPFSAYLVQAYEWRTALYILGAFIIFIGVPLVVVFLKTHSSNNLPDFEKIDDSKTLNPEMSGILFTNKWTDALKSFPFWQISLAYLVCGITTNILSVHFVPFAEDQGIPKLTAASIFGLMMGLNSVGVLLAGVTAMKINQKFVLGAAYTLRGIAYLMLLGVGGEVGLIMFAILGGISWLPTVSMTSLLLADIYGVKNLGTINGMSNMYHQIGGALCVFLTGEIQQMTGSYDIPFVIAGFTLIFASIISFSIREKRYSYKYNPVLAS